MEALDLIRGGVMIAYPMGLPAWDPVRMAIDDTEELAGTMVCLGRQALQSIIMKSPIAYLHWIQ